MNTLESLPLDDALRRSLRGALSGRLPQTLLLSGDDENALYALALTLAAGILCEAEGNRPCGACLSCRKVRDGIHPDLTIVDEGDRELKVDLARQLREDTLVLPNDGSRRVTILHHAHRLNPAAQNALLKILEDPPQFAFFLLTTAQPDTLLQTIRSRCTHFSLSPGEQEDTPSEELQLLWQPYLAALAAGDELAMMLAALPLEKIPRQTPLLPVFSAALRDALLCAEGIRISPLAPCLKKETAALARTVSPQRLLRLADLANELADRMARNAASAAMTNALTADAFAVCFDSDTQLGRKNH